MQGHSVAVQRAGGVSTDSDEAEYSPPHNNWIPWFCGLYGHEILAEVDDEFIRDGFNLFGLKARVTRYDDALSVLKGAAPAPEDLKKPDFRELHAQTAHLYGLIHARYILTPKGLMRMRQKYINGVFGRCPRVLCDQPCVLPMGLTDEMRQHRVRVYCPMCQEVYIPRSSGSAMERNVDWQSTISSNCEEEEDDSDTPRIPGNVDGAFFGPSFPQVFLLQFTGLIPKLPPKPHVPRIFGFKIRGVRSLIQVKLDCGEYGRSFALDNKNMRCQDGSQKNSQQMKDNAATQSKDRQEIKVQQ